MLTCGNSCDIVWEISILRETSEGLLVMSPNGDMVWMTHPEYKTFLQNRKERFQDREVESDNQL